MQSDGSKPLNQPPASVPIQSSPVNSVPMQFTQQGQPMMYGTPQQPMMGQQIMIQQRANNMSVTGMVMGIIGIGCYLLGWLICITWLIGWVFAILAIIFGHIGHAEGKRSGVGTEQGMIGCVLGYITMLGYIIPFLMLSI